MIIPSGLITESTFQAMFQDWVDHNRLVSAWDFENRGKLFSSVHSSFRFCLLTLAGSPSKSLRAMTFAFALHAVEDVIDADRIIQFTKDDIQTINPESRTAPPAPTRRDADLLLRLHRTFGVFMPSKNACENPWKSDSKQMVNVTHDSDDFVEPDESVVARMNAHGVSAGADPLLRLYDGKMIDQFDHRLASVAYRKDTTFRTSESTQTVIEHHQCPNHLALPQYWIHEERVAAVVPKLCFQRRWLIAYREVTASTNWRTIIASVVPQAGLLHTAPTIYSTFAASLQACLVGNLNSFALDFAARLKISGTHLSHFLLRQLPVLPPNVYSEHCPWASPQQSSITHQQFLLPRVLELTYTAWDLEPFARDCGYAGPPFRWDEERRFLLRAELDAAFFHLYGLNREDAAYILDTFPIVRRKDEAKYYGEYKTKTTILEIHDSLSESTRTGHSYQTRLTPPPGPPSAAIPDWLPGTPPPASWPSNIHEPRRGV